MVSVKIADTGLGRGWLQAMRDAPNGTVIEGFFALNATRSSDVEYFVLVHFFTKFLDMLDTFFIVQRGKKAQVSEGGKSHQDTCDRGRRPQKEGERPGTKSIVLLSRWPLSNIPNVCFYVPCIAAAVLPACVPPCDNRPGVGTCPGSRSRLGATPVWGSNQLVHPRTDVHAL